MIKCMSDDCLNKAEFDVSSSKDNITYWLCPNCYHNYLNNRESMQPPHQLTLSNVFHEPAKTLKLTPKKDIPLHDLIDHAHTEVNTNPSVNRIEFKYGSCYFVVAKLEG